MFPELVPVRELASRTKVIKGLQKLSNRFDTDWKVGNVLSECEQKKAFLMECDDGFIVYRIIKNRFTNESILFVWIVYAYKAGKKFIQDTSYHQFFKSLAEKNGAHSIEFETIRSGYDKKLPNYWKRKMITYSWRI